MQKTVLRKGIAVAVIILFFGMSFNTLIAASLNDDVEIYINSDVRKIHDNPDAASLGRGVIIKVVNHLNEPLVIYIQWDFFTLFRRHPIKFKQWRLGSTCDANSSKLKFSSTGTPLPCYLRITVQANDKKYVSRSGFIFFYRIYFPEVK